MVLGRTRERLITPVFALVMVSTFAYFVAIGIIMPTLPLFVEGPLGLGSSEVGLAVGAFAISAVLLRPWIGRIGDSRGRKVLIIGGGAAVAVSVAGYALAESLGVLVMLRILTGVGEAAFYVGAASVINDIVPDDRRAEALSYFSLALFGGLAVGPVLGETILHAVDFDMVWFVAAIAAGLSAVVGFVIPETRPDGVRFEKGPLISRYALLPGTVLATNIWALATFTSFLPLFALQIGLSGSKYVFAVNSGVIIAVRLFGARIPDRLGIRRTSRLALAFVAAGMLVMAAWANAPGLFAGTILYSLGHALAFPALMTLAINRAPLNERATVIGTVTAFFDLSFGVGAASAGQIASVIGYRGAFLSSAGVALAGIALLFGHARRSARVVTEAASEAA
jgi:MFS family permease